MNVSIVYLYTDISVIQYFKMWPFDERQCRCRLIRIYSRYKPWKIFGQVSKFCILLYKNFQTLSKIKLSHNWRRWQSRSSFQFVLVLHEYLLRLNIRILYVRLYCIWCHLYLCLTFHWTTILQFLPNKYIRSLNIWSIQQSCTETYSTITCIGEFTDHPNAGICYSLLTFCSFFFQYFLLFLNQLMAFHFVCGFSLIKWAAVALGM